MKRRVDFYKRITGRKFKEDVRRPSFDDTIAKQAKKSTTKYPLRLLGTGKKDVYITEEEREVNFHIIGGSRQGKSKYLEYHIRKDIDTGLGLCLIDPSDFGATFKAVLNYCASINHQKVLIIDPNTLYDYGKVACIQPLNAKFATRSAHSVKDAINTLLGSSEANTQRIQENLDALLRLLATQNLTLYESSYFTNYQREQWRPILDNATGADAQTIGEKFSSYGSWKDGFTTTITRLNVFNQEPLSLMVGAEGIDFGKMVDEGWVILCNLFPEPYLEPKTSTFLGILIISQIIRAVDMLNNRKEGFNKKFYLYIDEAGSFATPQIKLLLNNKSKSGLHLIFAHHHFSQFANQSDVLDAINHNTGVKIMFALRDDVDRLKMMRELGFPNPAEASHTYSNLPKRHFLVKNNKEYAVEVIAPYIENAFVSHETLETYIRERLKDPWYLTKGDIMEQIKTRIKTVDNTNDTPTADTPSPDERTIPDRKTNKHTPKTGRKSLLDLRDEAEKFIRDNQTPQADG